LHLPPGFDLVPLDEIPSTNDAAKQMAAAGRGHGTLVWAKRQTAGRGRQGNDWESPEGNLYMSLILRPELPLKEAGQLSFVTGVALGEAISSFLPETATVELKWPNDVLVNKKKIGGILIESEIQEDKLSWVVLGIGVNVLAAPDYAISLKQAGAEGASVEKLLEDVCAALVKWLQIWQNEGFAPVRKAWLRKVHGMGERISARMPGETIEGVFTGLDEQGALLLDIGSGDVLRITAGEVFFG